MVHAVNTESKGGELLGAKLLEGPHPFAGGLQFHEGNMAAGDCGHIKGHEYDGKLCWGELTGARRVLKLQAREDSTVQASYTPEETGDGLIVAVICADDTVVRLSPGDNALSLPEGRNWLVAASYHSSASFQVDLTLETGRLRVDTDVSLSS